jgi:hypothetical protein
MSPVILSGTGASARDVIFPPGQKQDFIANGQSYSVALQPTLATGFSVGTKILVAFDAMSRSRAIEHFEEHLKCEPSARLNRTYTYPSQSSDALIVVPSTRFAMKISSSFSLLLHRKLPLLLFTLWLAQAAITFAQGATPEPVFAKPQIAKTYGALPLSFEKNQGQFDPQIHFLSRGPGYSIVFKEHEAELLLTKRSSMPERPHQPGKRELANSKTDLLGMRLVGRNRNASLQGEDRLPGTVNYFAGNDPAKWLSGVPTFERVKYAGVYPGVDLTYYGNRQRLEKLLEPRVCCGCLLSRHLH